MKDVCMKDAQCFSKMEEQILSIRDKREHIRYKQFIMGFEAGRGKNEAT